MRCKVQCAVVLLAAVATRNAVRFASNRVPWPQGGAGGYRYGHHPGRATRHCHWPMDTVPGTKHEADCGYLYCL
jgi:hypothetical protein